MARQRISKEHLSFAHFAFCKSKFSKSSKCLVGETSCLRHQSKPHNKATSDLIPHHSKQCILWTCWGSFQDLLTKKEHIHIHIYFYIKEVAIASALRNDVLIWKESKQGMPCSPLITSTFLYGRIFALLKFEIDRGVHISTPQTKTVNHSPKYLINHEWTKYSIE